MGLLGFKVRKAMIFDKRGEFLAFQWFSKHAKTFSWKDNAFIVNFECPTFVDFKGLLWDTRYYFYNREHPNPINHEHNRKVILSPDELNIMLETNTAKKLNDLQKKGLQLNVKMIIIILAILGVGWYLISGGKIA